MTTRAELAFDCPTYKYNSLDPKYDYISCEHICRGEKIIPLVYGVKGNIRTPLADPPVYDVDEILSHCWLLNASQRCYMKEKVRKWILYDYAFDTIFLVQCDDDEITHINVFNMDRSDGVKLVGQTTCDLFYDLDESPDTFKILYDRLVVENYIGDSYSILYWLQMALMAQYRLEMNDNVNFIINSTANLMGDNVRDHYSPFSISDAIASLKYPYVYDDIAIKLHIEIGPGELLHSIIAKWAGADTIGYIARQPVNRALPPVIYGKISGVPPIAPELRDELSKLCGQMYPGVRADTQRDQLLSQLRAIAGDE